MKYESALQKSIKNRLEQVMEMAELFGLLVIGIGTALAMGHLIWKMADSDGVTLTDLLLMFLYLEVFAMVGQYPRSVCHGRAIPPEGGAIAGALSALHCHSLDRARRDPTRWREYRTASCRIGRRHRANSDRCAADSLWAVQLSEQS